jgi:hypothetical protein
LRGQFLCLKHGQKHIFIDLLFSISAAQQVEVLLSFVTDCKKLFHQNQLFYRLGIDNIRPDAN